MRTCVVLLLGPDGSTALAVTSRLREFLRRRTVAPRSTIPGWKALDLLAFPTRELAQQFRHRCGRPGSCLRAAWRRNCLSRAGRLDPHLDLMRWAPLSGELRALYFDFASWRIAERVHHQPFRVFAERVRPLRVSWRTKVATAMPTGAPVVEPVPA